MSMRGFVVAAPGSGAGKTTLTLALISALRRRGLAVAAAKSGPDYIDAAFHAAATGRPTVNLDSWAMPPDLLDLLVAGMEADLLVIEASMGLFDGVGATRGRSGAAADLAARFGLPVLLVLDVSAQVQSAAAVLRGFALHDPDVRIGGVVLNRVGGERHRAMLEEALAPLRIPVLGALPWDKAVALPERHLGLVQVSEHGDFDACLGRLADMAERGCDLEAIVTQAAPLAPAEGNAKAALAPPGQRVALASDDAFSFVYPHLLAGWHASGAEILPFSPLADEPPPESADACWLPGGYPELHAGALAANCRFLRGLRSFAETRPVHGECGGYMVLGRFLEDAGGVRHAMAALLDHATSFAERRLHLGYREARLLAPSPLGAAGTRLRGHEFHFATVIEEGSDEKLAAFSDAYGQELGKAGGRRGRVTGSFFHAIAAVR